MCLFWTTNTIKEQAALFSDFIVSSPVKFKFQGISHAQSLQLGALFYIHDHHNIWMEDCLLHLYLVRIPHQVHPHLSQAAVLTSYIINLINQFTCKRASESNPRITTLIAPHTIVLIMIYFEGCSQDLKFSGNCCLVKMRLMESTLEDLLMGNCMTDSQSWLIVWVSSYWEIMLSWVHPLTSVLALLFRTGWAECNLIVVTDHL